MNLEQLNCLIAVVEEGSISAGARRLNLTQPPVSLQLQRLEAQCGVQLLERGSRKIRLTEAGKCQGRVQFDPFGRLKVTQ